MPMTRRSARRRSACAIVAWAACALLAATPVAADLTIVNRAKIAIAELYVSAADDDSWGDNRLAGAAIDPGQASRLAQTRLHGCKIDLRAIYADGSVEDKRGLDACRTRQFTFDTSAAVTPRAFDEARSVHEVTIANHTPRAIVEIYISSAAADDWGDDLLAARPVAPGGKAVVKPVVSCTADLRVVYENRSAEERRDMDMCANTTLDIRPGWTTSDQRRRTMPTQPATQMAPG